MTMSSDLGLPLGGEFHRCLVCGVLVDVVTPIAEGDIICSRCRQRLWNRVTEFISQRSKIPQQEITRATWLADPTPSAADLAEMVAYCFSGMLEGFDSLDVVEAVMDLEEAGLGLTETEMPTAAGSAYDLMIRMLRVVAQRLK